MHHPARAWVGRVDARTGDPGRVDDVPRVSAIQASTGLVRREANVRPPIGWTLDPSTHVVDI